MGSNFGDNLKKIREKNGWTLEEMAEKLESTKQVLSRYERGERTPKITMAAKFAQILGVPLRELVGVNELKMDLKLFGPKEDPTPKTPEARIIAKGIDKMPQTQRKAIVNMMQGLYPGLFENGDEE